MKEVLAPSVAGLLAEREVPYALIGATAASRYGLTRATLDVDFFVVDSSVLKPEFWSPLQDVAQADCRRGDFTDSLRGLVRLRGNGEVVDVVVGKWKWETGVIERAESAQMWGRSVPVVRAADLILMKLSAGGGKDIWDVSQLLKLVDESVIEEVKQRLPGLQSDAQTLWERIRVEC
jgi:predicted nucleotidyltransferase